MPILALSDSALALFRLHIECRGQIEVDDGNRETYRELARAGPGVLSALTREGQNRPTGSPRMASSGRASFRLTPRKRGDYLARARLMRRAISLIGNSVLVAALIAAAVICPRSSSYSWEIAESIRSRNPEFRP